MIKSSELCPCGSGRKAAKCCFRPSSFRGFRKPRTREEAISCMTIREKNLFFVARIAESLQLSTLSRTSRAFQDTLASIKRALTPEAVRDIHLAIPEIWPNNQDLNRCFLELRDSHSGVFSGDYSYKTTLRLVNRHALYDSKIILIDPFLDYRILRDEFNPVLHPEKHLSNTLHYVLWWLSLVPWI